MKRNSLIILIVVMAVLVFLIPFYLFHSGHGSQTAGNESKPNNTQDESQASTSPTEPSSLPEGLRYDGYQLVNGTPWFYTRDGKPADKGWIDDPTTGEHLYYCKGNGELVTGWKYLEGKVWYFYPENDGPGDPRANAVDDPQSDNTDDQKRSKPDAMRIGALARSYTTTGGFEIPEVGYFDGDEGLAMAYGLDVLNRYGNDLESAYRYSASLRFVERDDLGADTKIHEAAQIGFETGEGNCMVWSGTFCTMARLLGYDCRLIWGTLQWQGTRPHAWTEIWVEGDDEPHIYDPRKNEGHDLSGFDKRYGEKGTYKYDEDSKIYLEW